MIAILLGVAVVLLRGQRRTQSLGSPFRPSSPARLTEVEPNADRTTAQVIDAPATEVVGELTGGDVDVFSFTAEPGGHVLAVQVSLTGARVRVEGEDGKQLASAVSPDRVDALGLAPGRHYLFIDGGSRGVTGAYRLSLRMTPWAPGGDWEPNDDLDHAQTMAKRRAEGDDLAHFSVAGSWSRADDVDCFVVPLAVPPQGAVVRLALAPPPAARGSLVVYDEGDREAGVPPKILARAESPGTHGWAVVPALGARSWEQRYVVCVRAYDDAPPPPSERYTLDVRIFTPKDAFEFEPNDGPETASALPDGVHLGAYLPDGDVDWYRLSAGAGAPRAVVTPPAGLSVDVAVYDAAGRLLRKRTGQPGEVVTVDATGAEHLTVARATGHTEQPYDLIFIRSP